MAIDFPNSPTVNDTYTAGGKTWQWTGTYWSAYGTSPILRASDTAPLSPNANDLWYETDTGSLFAYVDGYWVELGASAPVTASAGDLTGATLASNVVSSALIPVGVINPYAGSTAPTGWLLCSNQPVSRTTYSALFAVIGTTYGSGDGSTTFNVPDLRGRTVAGLDNMDGTDAGRLDIANSRGTVVGTQYVTLTSAQSGVPAHSHANTLTNNAVTSGAMSANSTHDHGGVTGSSPFFSATAAGGSGLQLVPPSNGVIGNQYYQNHTIASQDLSHTHSVTSNVTITNVDNATANAASAHNNMQPTMVLNYIIKAL